MVFGFMMPNGEIHVTRRNGSYNSDAYIEIVDEHVMPYLGGDRDSNYVYQQDNARPHVSKKSMAYFDSKNVELLTWPARSPDLNPMENVWKMMVDYIYTQERPANLDELWSKIQDAAEHVNANSIKLLYDSMARRCIKVIQKNGDIINN